MMAKLRWILGVLALIAAAPAVGQEALNATAARSFVAGKLFSFRCFDGTYGAGRIFNDGSVIGRIRFGGNGLLRFVRLPEGTLYQHGEQICASLRGMPFNPCFNLTRTSDRSFRGALASFGLGFMYCDFQRYGRTLLVRRRAPSVTGSITGGAAPPAP
jgi:hypothetical protein